MAARAPRVPKSIRKALEATRKVEIICSRLRIYASSRRTSLRSVSASETEEALRWISSFECSDSGKVRKARKRIPISATPTTMRLSKTTIIWRDLGIKTLSNVKVWHRLPGAPLRNRVKGCSQEGHFDLVRVAGCPPPSCSARSVFTLYATGLLGRSVIFTDGSI